MTADQPAADAPGPAPHVPDAPADVVMALTYYAPYVSGLTNAARDVAVGLAARGARVTVVATRHDPALPREEVLDGVRVIRTPVALRVGKGAISPGFLAAVARETRGAGVLNLHLPMLEAGPVAVASRAPVVLTYQCDVSLPPGPANAAQRLAVDASSRLAMARAQAVGVTSEDYAHHSRLWSAMAGKEREIPAPCLDRAGGSPRFRDGDGFHVGFLGRIVEEKGVHHLVQGFQALDDPDARLLIAGDFAAVAGGSVIEAVRAAIGGDDRIRVLGFVPDAALADLYASLDVFALPSVNAFEAFGIAAVEAMMTGVPELASDLPGVRQPVLRTGYGAIAAPRDAASIAAGLRALRDAPPPQADVAAAARAIYGVERTVAAYGALFEEVGAQR